ncbi:hypothetical protein [Salirhabdus salicampi]|uniref:hypothetical protein n=1 Tax=Salirhabdus salicampi TaxID=476102 RepID=UPI0020C4530B|nr:hypothetical protein [Salirhabdus salicampi]MCP8617300.1 hypothetical protein [Salirhabdus salicampi]
MEVNERLEIVLKAVREAEQAVIESQANNSPQQFQRAEQLLMSAQKMINALQKGPIKEQLETNVQFRHAKELLKHLHEAQQSLETGYFS